MCHFSREFVFVSVDLGTPNSSAALFTPNKTIPNSFHGARHQFFTPFLGLCSHSFWAFLFYLLCPMLWPLHTHVMSFCARSIIPIFVRILTRLNIGPNGQKTVVKNWLWSKISSLHYNRHDQVTSLSQVGLAFSTTNPLTC